MPLLQHVIAGRIRRTAAKLQASVGVQQPRSDDGRILRQMREVFHQASYHIRMQLRVVVEHEAIAAVRLPQGEVVVLGETAYFVAFDELHLRPVGPRLLQILPGEEIGHHQNLMGDGAMLLQASEARIQIVRPVHADNHDAHFGSSGGFAGGIHVSCQEGLPAGRGRGFRPQGRRRL